MATYMYRCKNKDCDIYDLVFEVQQSMKEPNLTTCPDCKQETTLQKVIGESGGFRIGGMGVHKPTAHWGS